MGQLSQQVCFDGVYMYYGYTPGKGYSGLSGGQVEILTTCAHAHCDYDTTDSMIL